MPTIHAAIAQRDVAFRLVLIDNLSTDGTAALCRKLLEGAPHIEVTHIQESQPGPSYALEAGFAAVTTDYVAFWNADTWYPPDYLRRAQRLLESSGAVAAMAIDIDCAPNRLRSRMRRYQRWLASRLWPRQAHTGTFGQCFRTRALRNAGGPRSDAWPWVLDDHELMHRVFTVGSSAYCSRFWCISSNRRQTVDHVRWTLTERLLYHFTPYRAKDWFFYRFLAKRFAARKMIGANLRDRDWDGYGSSRPVGS